MYNKILSDISQQYYRENYPNDGQRFVAWYLRNIHNLDTIETKDCITDGAGDKQIDAVYIDNDASMIYIIQGKFYAGETVNAEPLREVLSSWIQIKDLQKLQVIFSCFTLFQTNRTKTDVIRRTKLKQRTVSLSFDSQLMALTVQMPIAAYTHLILLQKR